MFGEPWGRHMSSSGGFLTDDVKLLVYIDCILTGDLMC